MRRGSSFFDAGVVARFEARSRSGARNKFSIREFDVYLKKIDGSQHHRSISLSLLSKLTRCSLLNYFAQPDKLICPLIWFHVTPTVKIVHPAVLIAHRITLPRLSFVNSRLKS
jgi:hypothetical protein